MTRDGAAADRAGAPPSPAPAAQWRSHPAAEPWVPDALRPHLPWAGEIAYRDVESVEGAGATGWRLLGISQRGRVHAHDGTHREDALALEGGAHGFALVAADGAGSSRYARVASALVCRQVAGAAAPLLHDGAPIGADGTTRLRAALVQGLADACGELQRIADAAALPLRDFRTTALAVLAIGERFAAVQVGDGAIVSVARDGTVTRVGVGESGDFSGEVTAFVPDVDAGAIAARVVTSTLEGAEAILLLTDGVEDPFYPIERRGAEIARQLYHGVHAPAEGFRAQPVHGPIVGHPDALDRLAQWIAFERRGENDDRTLLGAFRTPSSFAG